MTEKLNIGELQTEWGSEQRKRILKRLEDRPRLFPELCAGLLVFPDELIPVIEELKAGGLVKAETVSRGGMAVSFIRLNY